MEVELITTTVVSITFPDLVTIQIFSFYRLYIPHRSTLVLILFVPPVFYYCDLITIYNYFIDTFINLDILLQLTKFIVYHSYYLPYYVLI